MEFRGRSSRTSSTISKNGFVDRTIVSEKPFGVEYSLTNRGRSLEPVIIAVLDWGREHLTPPEEG